MRNQTSSAVLGNRPGVFLLTSVIFAFCWTAAAQDIKIYVSSKAGDRIAPKPALHFEQRTDSSAPAFEINDSVAYQKIAGFGASLLEAGLICINSLPPAEQEAVLRALFDPKEGAGFSAMKTVIASTVSCLRVPFIVMLPSPRTWR